MESIKRPETYVCPTFFDLVDEVSVDHEALSEFYASIPRQKDYSVEESVLCLSGLFLADMTGYTSGFMEGFGVRHPQKLALFTVPATKSPTAIVYAGGRFFDIDEASSIYTGRAW